MRDDLEDEEEEKQDDDNEGEDVRDADEGERDSPKSNEKPKMSIEKEVEEEKPPHDYSLLDMFLTKFFETQNADMLPVLCGYFDQILMKLYEHDRDPIL